MIDRVVSIAIRIHDVVCPTLIINFSVYFKSFKYGKFYLSVPGTPPHHQINIETSCFFEEK